MTATELVRARLLAISALTALVGQRVYALKLPQNVTMPAVRVTEISQQEPMHLRGSAGVATARVQVDVYADELSVTDPYGTALAVEAAAHGGFSAGAATGLIGWDGDAGSPSTDVLAVLPLSRQEVYESEELRRVVVSRDYAVTWRTA